MRKNLASDWVKKDKAKQADWATDNTVVNEPHQHVFNVVTKWDHHASRYTGILDYSEALEVMCSGCLERKTLEETI